MDYSQLKKDLEGLYITIPTLFNDPDMTINEDGIRQHISFLRSNGINRQNAVLLAGGAAGDFSTMSFEERVRVAGIVKEAAGEIPVAVGAQTTSTMELQRLAQAAEEIGASFIQVSCPFYFNHTQDDFYEHILAVSRSAKIGLIIYNTFWTSAEVSFGMVERLIEIPQVVGLKWATKRSVAMEFEDVVQTFSSKLTVIDNDLLFPISHMLGAKAFEVHLCNHWPEWGVKLLATLEKGDYKQVELDMIKEALPYYRLWKKIEQTYTVGDGFVDKLCMELIGLPSSRCRPPTRDIREQYREEARQMLIQCGTPRVIAA
ncbi:MAG: dihydrodipicolinate synthase family protein [Proteobacteria bacterium]|nr:MAG: dihydrodipicolinate synthase family protein [Pseudomonadota bacterium]|tara:strand:- start:2793 stop:3740 length:948 start_codon:yes stop_codon:yes gene_type:complete